jgi:hypothetical protein
VERGVAGGGGAKWKEIVRVERGVLDVERSVTRGGSREEREVSTGDGERDQRKKICGGVDSRVFLFLYA